MAGMTFVLVLLAAWLASNGAILVAAVAFDRSARSGVDRPSEARPAAVVSVPFRGRSSTRRIRDLV
jgi:predicted anti-sigma-YlaC factor YlaD